MKRSIVSLAVAIVVILSVVPMYAATINFFQEMKPISVSAPYVSPTMTPQSDRISYSVSLMNGLATQSYTVYLQELSGGMWYNVENFTLAGHVGRSSSFDVTPGTTYRIRATSTDSVSRTFYCWTYENV